MNREHVYNELEARALSYLELRNVPVDASRESLVSLPTTANLSVSQIGTDMFSITGDAVFVRETVAYKLGDAAFMLAETDSELCLEVVYGYRALNIQQKLFMGFYDQLRYKLSGDELLEAVHRLIAVPDVAGHPTGGAVDIQITRNGVPIDFETRIWEFVPDSFTFSPFISKEAAQNRKLLRDIMTAAGFAPYDGEWWHFSYGDKEWAKYYEQPFAIYEQLEFNVNL